jgi:hypothetical protein
LLSVLPQPPAAAPTVVATIIKRIIEISRFIEPSDHH